MKQNNNYGLPQNLMDSVRSVLKGNSIKTNEAGFPARGKQDPSDVEGQDRPRVSPPAKVNKGKETKTKSLSGGKDVIVINPKLHVDESKEGPGQKKLRMLMAPVAKKLGDTAAKLKGNADAYGEILAREKPKTLSKLIKEKIVEDSDDELVKTKMPRHDKKSNWQRHNALFPGVVNLSKILKDNIVTIPKPKTLSHIIKEKKKGSTI